MEYVFWYKLACLSVGLTIVCLGYVLFLKGIFNESGDMQGSFKNYKLVIRKAAPGTYFVLFGSLLIAFTVFKGLDSEEFSSHRQPSNDFRVDTTAIIKIK
jgi:hypothetical protein